MPFLLSLKKEDIQEIESAIFRNIAIDREMFGADWGPICLIGINAALYPLCPGLPRNDLHRAGAGNEHRHLPRSIV